MTPESDDALYSMLRAMHQTDMPGSYGLVGKKVLALRERGRADILQELAQERSIGFHSTSHSEHPTIAEELAGLDYGAARERFLQRERPGVEAVTAGVKAPRYFTQPGANWVPEAAETLPALGMDVYFTDSFNSYVVDLTGPYWYGDVVLLSFPVVNPRPFGLGLPGNLHEAIELIEEWEGQSGCFMVMLHPTELVTYEFWDAVNFGRGKTRDTLVPGPVRTRAEQQTALESFSTYLQEIRRKDIEWSDATAVRDEIAPRRPVEVSRPELEAAIRQQGWGPLSVSNGYLSAAEALYAWAKLVNAPKDARVSVGYVAAPDIWESDDVPGAALNGDQLERFAQGLVDAVEQTGRLPSDTHLGTLQQGMRGLMGTTKIDEDPAFLTYIKPPNDLHWGWPIFPEGFEPTRLWKDARRLAWTLKPAESIAR